jgi:hypothetical protein
MNENATCIHCGQPAYKGTLHGDLCRLHYIAWLEKQLGVWVKYSQNYQQAIEAPAPTPQVERCGATPIPLFEMEKSR